MNLVVEGFGLSCRLRSHPINQRPALKLQLRPECFMQNIFLKKRLPRVAKPAGNQQEIGTIHHKTRLAVSHGHFYSSLNTWIGNCRTKTFANASSLDLCLDQWQNLNK